MKLVKEISIKAPADKIYHAYANIQGWKDVLNDVMNVNVYYDDGYHQEFDMTVQRENKQETVHSIRFCYPHTAIEIFQTTPPPHFTRMSGSWKFISNNKDTLVQATREFDIRPNAQFDVAILEKFLIHNLSSFKNWIEKSA